MAHLRAHLRSIARTPSRMTPSSRHTSTTHTPNRRTSEVSQIDNSPSTPRPREENSDRNMEDTREKEISRYYINLVSCRFLLLIL